MRSDWEYPSAWISAHELGCGRGVSPERTTDVLVSVSVVGMPRASTGAVHGLVREFQHVLEIDFRAWGSST